MIIEWITLSYLLDDHSTKAMADENYWSMFRMTLLEQIFRLVRVNKHLAGENIDLFAFIIQSREQLDSA